MNGSRPARMRIAPMELADIPQVVAIDRLSFPNPWSANSYRHELSENIASHFKVALDPAPALARPGLLARLIGQQELTPRRVVGYVGFWFVVDEVHISTIAVHPDWRGRGVGEQLLVAVLRSAVQLNATQATLEVRVSNAAAQNLYRKYGFAEAGYRKRYYRDNNEDALLMTVRLDEAQRAKIVGSHSERLARRKA
ncbi:MAG: ribosomal protein S18-alanine N-acetyltransferase [Anaerolineales bacterium]